MNASKTRESKEAQAAEKPVDLFAVDFFGDRNFSAKDKKTLSIVRETKSLYGGKRKTADSGRWVESLPRLTRDEFEFSNRLEKLPANLTKAAAHKISETVTRYTFQAPKTVRCQLISITEVNLPQTLGQLEKSPQTFLALGCQPDNSTALIAFDTGFASSVIDLILSGKGEALNVPRRLSAIENTIIEFLAGNILTGINEWLGQNIFCLQSVENELEKIFEKNERGAEAIFRLDFADFSGIITLLASREFLKAIDKRTNPLLFKTDRTDNFRVFEKIAPQLRFRIAVGKTVLDAESLFYLEPGDIVLIEQQFVNYQNSMFFGGGTVNLGSGENFNLNGQFLQGAAADGLSFRLEEIKSTVVRRKQNFERLGMEHMETEKAEETNIEETGERTEDMVEKPVDAEKSDEIEESTIALENILVNLRVEIAGDKISLREVQRLRPGQIINLGCRPTDAVKIVADTSDQPVALGELVDIEGRLGVRLTMVFI